MNLGITILADKVEMMEKGQVQQFLHDQGRGWSREWCAHLHDHVFVPRGRIQSLMNSTLKFALSRGLIARKKRPT